MADAYYAGAYILYDDGWRNSFLCKTLSYLSVLSTELSIVVLVCITTERYINIFNVSCMRLNTSNIKLPWIMMPMAWGFTLIIALLPLLLSWIFGESYSASNSICIFLEMSTKSAYKAAYLFCVFGVINGVCFLTILVIYVQIIHLHIKSAKRVGREANLILLKRTLLIVITNFLCWAPLTGLYSVFLQWQYSII